VLPTAARLCLKGEHRTKRLTLAKLCGHRKCEDIYLDLRENQSSVPRGENGTTQDDESNKHAPEYKTAGNKIDD
jgi:hypothetical protein